MGGSDFLPLNCGVGSGVERKRRVCVSVCVTEGALLSRLAKQLKCVCQGGQAGGRSVKVGQKEGDRGGGGAEEKDREPQKRTRKRRSRKSWLKAASVCRAPPQLSSPPLRSAGSKRGKKKRFQSERERGEGERERVELSPLTL